MFDTGANIKDQKSNRVKILEILRDIHAVLFEQKIFIDIREKSRKKEIEFFDKLKM